MNKINIYKNPHDLAQKFGDYLAEFLQGQQSKYLALSGGSTPGLLFDYLADKYASSPIWQKTHIYWGDERCVPPDNDDSNFKMTQNHLLGKITMPANNIHRILGEENPTKEAVRYGKEIAANLPSKKGLPSFDLLILGLGDDGHTASIFPDHMELLDSPNICEVARHPSSGQKRITLTGKTINNAREIAFLVTGANKSDKVAEIINQTGKCKRYPAFYIKPDHGRLQWFLDEAAAGKL